MSNILNLFGMALEFKDSGTRYETLTYDGRDYICVVEGALKNPEKTLFELSVDGELPNGRLTLHQQFACVVDGGVIRLIASKGVLGEQPKITLGLDRNRESTTIKVEPDLSGKYGIVVIDQASPIQKYLSEVDASDGIENVVLDYTLWGTTSIFFDVPNNFFRAIPSETRVVFDDVLSSTYDESIEKQQSLPVREIVGGAASLSIRALPEKAALLLHPDILDTKAVRRYENGNEVANDFLYQYALVNGQLLWTVPFGHEREDTQLRWVSADGYPDPGMVVFRHRDEHGNPIVLVPRHPERGFRLGFRVGHTFEVEESQEPAAWEMTNRGACVVLDRDTDNNRIPLDCELRGMDPLVLYGRPRKTEPDVDDDPFDDPYWLTDGNVIYADRVPMELHGLLKGTFMRCRPDILQDAWDGGATGHTAQIVVNPVEDRNQREIFHKSEILLMPAANWTFTAQVEERRVYNGISQEPPSLKITKRVAKSDKEDAVRLPLIDTAYALANLAGIERINIDGENLGDAPILRDGIRWLNELDAQFSKQEVYAAPELGMNTHISGRGLVPPTAQPFETVVALPPTTARSIKSTELPGPTMKANVLEARGGVGAEASGAVLRSFESSFYYGGVRDSQAQDTVSKDRDRIDGLLCDLRESFVPKFLDPEGLPSPERKAVTALKRYLLGDRPYANPERDGDAPEQFFSDMLQVAISLLENEVLIPGVDEDELDFLREYLNSMDAREFEDFWRGRVEEDFLKQIISLVFAPPDGQIIRRAVTAIYPELRDLRSLLDRKGYEKLVAGVLKDHVKVLRESVLPFDLDGLKDFSRQLGGFPVTIEEGIDALQVLARKIWEEHQNDIMDDLRREFGPYLTDDVYAALLEQADQAAQFLATLKQADELFGQLKNLGDLKTFKPYYLFFTKRFKTKQLGDQIQADKLWSQKFDLCRLGESIKWNFFLDSEASVLVKLTEKKTLPQLLRAVEAEYKTDSRPNPLGFPPIPADEDEAENWTPLDRFVDMLHPSLKAADWTGVFVISPMADISEDIVLRDLAGLEYIQAAYAAIGGAKPEDHRDDNPAIDVIASIFKEESKPKDLNDSKKNRGDLDFALVKLDVTIKNTKIEDGEIVFRLDPQTIWGRAWRTEEDEGEEAKKKRRMFVRGTIPKEEKAAGEEKAPPSFEFAAWFDPPKTIDINVAFIKSFTLKSIRIGRHKGRTAMEIDGKIDFQKYSVEKLGIEIFEDGKDKVEPLQLSDFRILLPALKPGEKIDFGVFRDLDFDFSSINFVIPRPRAINLWGIEVIPNGLAFFRRSLESGFKELEGRFNWLDGLKLGNSDEDLSVPMIEFAVDFGKLPEFGGSNLKGLKFQLALAIGWKENSVKWTSLGLSGVEAKDLKIDLFRLLSLKVGEFKLDRFVVEDPTDSREGKRPAGGIIAKDVELKLLDWSPLPMDSELSMLFLQPDTSKEPDTLKRSKQGKAGLVYYGVKDPSEIEKDFLRIFWVLLAHNLALAPKVLNFLMFEGYEGGHESIMDDIVPRDGESRGRLIKAKILDEESWLTGVSFGLGDILDECSFVLHDKHYYGIRLSAFWVPKIFGQRTIELAYIPGTAPSSDRFRTNLRLPFLDMLGFMRSGEFALEWAANWDFLIDIGFPWKTRNGANWFRSFAAGQGVEAKLGFYFDKRTELIPAGNKSLTISAGMGYYAGYYWGSGNGTAWVRAGIGVFAILEGKVTFENSSGGNPLRGSIVRLEVTGVIGIFAYGEGGIDVWILSARFRVAAIAAIEAQVLLQKNSPTTLTYTAYMYAYYSGSVRVGSGLFKWTFRVSGRIGTEVTGQLLLN